MVGEDEDGMRHKAWDGVAAQWGSNSCRMHALLTYQHFPLAVGLGHLVGAAHLIQAHSSKDENNEAGAASVFPGGLILVPVSIAGAEGERAATGDSSIRAGELKCTAGARAVTTTLLETPGYPTRSSQQLCLRGSHPDVCFRSGLVLSLPETLQH